MSTACPGGVACLARKAGGVAAGVSIYFGTRRGGENLSVPARFDYNTREYLQSITCPVFVAHSPQDDIVPYEHRRALYQAALGPKQFLELQGGHNDGFVFMREEWVRALGAFLDSRFARRAAL